MTDRDQTMLHDAVVRYAENIEAVASARALLRDHEGTWWGDTDLNDRQAIADARELLELPAFVPNTDAATDVADGLDDLPGQFDDALEIRVEGYRTGYDPEFTAERVRICVGLGGPNVFVYYDGDSAWIDAYWGGSRVEGFPITNDHAVADIASACDYMLEV